MTLPRILRVGMKGPDALAAKRALKKAGYGRGIILSREFGRRAQVGLRAFQYAKGLKADGVLGPETFAELLPFVDLFGRALWRRAPIRTPQDVRFDKLMSAMKLLTLDTPGYRWGGGHGIPLRLVSPHQGLDCSSSCSLALWMAGMFPHSIAFVSGQFASSWGEPGPGKIFTVYANGEHVWIRLHKGPYWRFDTSPHGDGGRGPRLRRLPRFSSTFAARHFPGM